MSKWHEPITGTIKRLNGALIQASISNISDDGKSGIADIEGRKAHVEWFYDTHAITMVNNQPTITGSGMWYEQLEPTE